MRMCTHTRGRARARPVIKSTGTGAHAPAASPSAASPSSSPSGARSRAWWGCVGAGDASCGACSALPPSAGPSPHCSHMHGGTRPGSDVREGVVGGAGRRHPCRYWRRREEGVQGARGCGSAGLIATALRAPAPQHAAELTCCRSHCEALSQSQTHVPASHMRGGGDSGVGKRDGCRRTHRTSRRAESDAKTHASTRSTQARTHTHTGTCARCSTSEVSELMLQLGHLERAGAELELGLCGTPRAHAGHGGRDDGGMRPPAASHTQRRPPIAARGSRSPQPSACARGWGLPGRPLRQTARAG